MKSLLNTRNRLFLLSIINGSITLPLLAITTVAPSDASSVAIDLPIPDPPPVTKATLPAKRDGR